MKRAIQNLFSWKRGLLLSVLLAAAFPFSAYPECNGCHTAILQGEYRHSPIEKSGCFSCHYKVEGKEHPKEPSSMKLQKGSPDLCVDCHGDTKINKGMAHKPAAEGKCLDCHNPHTSDFPALAKGGGKDLCLKCHKDNFRYSNLHKPVADGNCTSCHDPHAAESGHLLKAFSSDLCLKCHSPAIMEGISVHAPVEAGDCHSCHYHHGGNNRKLLRKNYNASLYSEFSEEAFALCFECHRVDAFTEAVTATLTKFRNGDENLHYRHLMLKNKGRACFACHEVHSSPQSRLVKTEVSGFGAWVIPISYISDENGGTCIVGCHKPKSYDRVRYFTNP